MERRYNGKMIRMQILRDREHSKKDLLTYYQVFQNIRHTLQELYLQLAPDKEHKKLSPDVPVV